MIRTLPTVLFALVLGLPSALFAQSIDLTFGTNGMVPYGGANSNGQQNQGTGNNSAVQPDGKIVVAMDRSNPNTTDLFYYTYRYNPDGTPDMDFGVNGVSRLFVGDQCKSYDLHLEEDGRIVVIGHSEYCINGICGAAQFIMMRLLPNGGLDTTFGTNGHVTSAELFGNQGTFALPYRVRKLNGGKYLVAGRSANGRPFVARLLNNGFPDPAYATNGIHIAATSGTSYVDMDVDADQNGFLLMKVANYINGQLDTTNITDVIVLKLGPNGTPVTSYGTAGEFRFNLINNDTPQSITVVPNGQTVITGQGWLGFVTANGAFSSTVPNGVRQLMIPGEESTYIDRLVVAGPDRYLLSGKAHTVVAGNYQEKGFVAQVNALGQWRSDFNGAGFMLFDNGSVGSTGWNGKLCRLHDVDIAPGGTVYATGYRNPTAGNTLRALFLLKLRDVPIDLVGVGMDDLNTKIRVQVYPNPTDNAFRVELEVPAHFGLYDAQGGLVQQGRLMAGVNLMELGADRPAGAYMLRISDDAGADQGTYRLVKY